jgi:hypothetical protein
MLSDLARRAETIARMPHLRAGVTIFVGIPLVKTKILSADGGGQTLLRRIRAHTNFTANVPITLIAITAADNSGADNIMLRAAGVTCWSAASCTSS